MKYQSFQYDAPAFWASYYINNDDSSLDGEEIYQADKFLAEKNLPFPVSCEPDQSFIGHFHGKLCDLLTYTFLL